jgi:hypothetical protein
MVSYDLVLPFQRWMGRLVPLLQVLLERPDGQSGAAQSILDTGADVSCFDGLVAGAIGFDPTQGPLRVVPLVGIAGPIGVSAFVHRVILHVGTPMRSHAFPADVAFTPLDVQLPANVLGRQDVLRHVRFGLDGAALPQQLYLGFPPTER